MTLKNKSLAMLSPLCLCLVAVGARAAIEPFTVDASESIKHETNISHAASGGASDWVSTTSLRAGVDQALGRNKFVADAGVNYNAYKNQSRIDSWGYQAGAQLDWNTIGDLSGAFGADTSRRQYIYGVTSDPLPIPGQPPATPVTERNMQTDNHVFGRILLGGPSRWQLFAGADGSQRRYSAEAFRSNDENQWSSNFGTRYSTSPDLTFGLVANYGHGEFPHVEGFSFGGVTQTKVSRFNTRSINGTVQLRATGNSEFDAGVGYTTETSDALTDKLHFVNGSLNWTWTPPSHFTVKVGLKRSTDMDNSSTAANAGLRYANSLSGPSINNLALLDVGYALTAKITLDATATYSQRKYTHLALVDADGNPVASGTMNTSSYYLSAHYQPTRTTDVSCGAGHEQRRAGANFAAYAYTDNTVRCTAAIKFD